MQVKDVPMTVVFKNKRGRRVSLLPPGSAERACAERILEMREQGFTMAEVSRETGLSLSTIRRMLSRLLLTNEVESGVHDTEIRHFLPGARGRKPSTDRFRPAGSVPAVAARKAG